MLAYPGCPGKEAVRRLFGIFLDDITVLLTTYVDAVYCCDRVASSVGRLVCRSVTLVSPAKVAEPIEIPFGLRTWVGPGNHVLDGV